MGIQYVDRKMAILAELEKRARAGKTIYYSELGAKVGIPAQGPWKPVLDQITREVGDPDITYLVINKTYRLPGQIGFTRAKPPTQEQRDKAALTIAAVFAKYRT